MKKTPLTALVLAAFLAIPACGCPEEECVDSGEPDVGYDAGYDAGTPDSGEDAGSDAGEDGGNGNLPPVAKLKYELDYSGDWIEVREGDTVSKPYNYGISWDVCASDDDRGISYMGIIIGDDVRNYTVPLPCRLIGDASSETISKVPAVFIVRDSDGVESKINFFFESI